MSTREDREIDAYEDAVWEDHQAARDEGICPGCGGDGEVQLNYGLVNWDEPRYTRCPACMGSGAVSPDDEEEAPDRYFRGAL